MNAHLYNVRKILKINFLCILFGPILLYRRRSFLPKNQKWTITASLSQQEEKVKSKKKKWCCYWSSCDVRLRGGRYKVETPANNSQSAASQGNRKKKLVKQTEYHQHTLRWFLLSLAPSHCVHTDVMPGRMNMNIECIICQNVTEIPVLISPPVRTSLMLIRPFMHDTANSP